jgi:hypothetical protein
MCKTLEGWCTHKNCKEFLSCDTCCKYICDDCFAESKCKKCGEVHCNDCEEDKECNKNDIYTHTEDLYKK